MPRSERPTSSTAEGNSADVSRLKPVTPHCRRSVAMLERSHAPDGQCRRLREQSKTKSPKKTLSVRLNSAFGTLSKNTGQRSRPEERPMI
jgi:hypothetical protein